MSVLYEQYLELELLTDVCTSSSNRTLEASAPQGCLPGRLLWGVLANRAYRGGWSDDDTFRIFHQGTVRFRDALPLDGSAPAYPVPRACQRPKAVTGDQGARNMSLPSVRQACAGTQLRPMKDVWSTADGVQVTPATRYSLRTSVDASGRAREGHLYGLPALEAGQRFASALIGPKADVEKVLALLRDRTLRIGRSRNAEMGLVKVRVKGGSPRLSDLYASPAGAPGQLSFLCVSRCALRDRASGAATSVPFPEAFGLDGRWTFDAASSFIDTTRVVHFNGYRRRPEPERLVLERGSVVTFRGPADEVDVAALRARLHGGVGDHIGEGYGEVAVAPMWLVSETIAFTEKEDGRTIASPVAEPQDELFTWARGRARQRKTSAETFEAAHALITELRLRRIARAQWGGIHRMAREARFDAGKCKVLMAQLKDLLYGGKVTTVAVKDSYEKVVGERKIVSGGARNLDPMWRAVRDAFLDRCGRVPTSDLPFFLEHLASACMRPEPRPGNDGGERR